MNKKLLLQLLVVFIIVNSIGLIVANYLIKENVQVIIVSENKQAIENSIGLIAYILVTTAIILIIIKFLKKKLVFSFFKAIELLAIFGASEIVFEAFFPAIISLILAIALVISRIVFKENILLRNVSSIFAIIGAGALIGVSLGTIPVIIFLGLLAVYDYIAVFKTKHMITMAKAITSKNLAFTIALPTKERKFELGTGDLVLPLMLSASIFAEFKPIKAFPISILPSTLILIASIIGLVLTMQLAEKKKQPMPALPLQAILMIIAYGIIKISMIFY